MKRKIFIYFIIILLITLYPFKVLALSYGGYNTIGGTNTFQNPNNMICQGPWSVNPGGVTTIEEINTDANDMDITLGIYVSDNAGTPSPIGGPAAVTSGGQLTPSTAGWRGHSITYTLVANTNYFSCAWGAQTGSSPQWKFFYDSHSNFGGVTTSFTYSAGTMPTLSGSIGGWGNDFSIRVGYNAGAPPSTKHCKVNLLGVC